MDFKSAFEQFPMHMSQLPLLGLTLVNLYFLYPTMPFWVHSSCQCLSALQVGQGLSTPSGCVRQNCVLWSKTHKNTTLLAVPFLATL